MRHLFGKEHKEHKSLKLVKKLQLEEDKKWQQELQRRLEQEEKDADFARELQEQMTSNEPTTSSSTTTQATVNTIESDSIETPSPTIWEIIPPASLTPPPLPAKPTAYHSVSFSSNSSGINIDRQQYERVRPQETPLITNVTLPSSSSQQHESPPPYQSTQPPLPPRQRSSSLISQCIPLTPIFSSNTVVSSAPPMPSSPEHFYTDTHQPTYYTSPPRTQQQVYPATTFTDPPLRRDPAMLIVPPPRKEKQSATDTNYLSTITSMPEPIRSTTPFKYPATNPFALSANTTPSELTNQQSMPGSYHSSSSTSQPMILKPDTKLEWYDIQNTPNKTTEMEEDDDNDGNESMLWERNDGRMMENAPIPHHSPSRKTSSISYNSSESEDDDSQDFAIDPFDIKTTDQVIIHRHAPSNPFDDCFAMMDSDKTEPVGHAKPHFQMNTNSSTTAMVHDPLLKMTTTIPWSSTGFTASSVTINPSIGLTPSRPTSIYQMNSNDEDDDNLDSSDIHQVQPTNVLRAGAPPNIQSMIKQVTSEVPSNEFGYYQYQINEPGGEKEQVDLVEHVKQVLPKRNKTNPDHRHITVPSVIENQRVWILVHPTDTGKSLASRIHIVATYKTRKILRITTDKGRSIPLDDTPVFRDWSEVMHMQDGAAWTVEWIPLENHLWEGPKEFLRYLKTSLLSSS